jgi:hypothetical protein
MFQLVEIFVRVKRENSQICTLNFKIYDFCLFPYWKCLKVKTVSTFSQLKVETVSTFSQLKVESVSTFNYLKVETLDICFAP